MRILFVAPRFHTNQAELVRALIDTGHEVQFLVERQGFSEDHRTVVPLVVPVGRAAGRRYLRGAFDYYRPEGVILRNPNVGLARLALSESLHRSIPRVLYTQGPKWVSSRRHILLVKAIMARLLQALWITPVRGKLGPGAWSSRRVRYLPFAKATEVPRGPPGGGPLRLMAVGKMVPRKRLIELVEVAARLGERVQMRIIGEVSSQEHQAYLALLRRRITDLGIEDRVDLLVNVPPVDMGIHYSWSHIFLLASVGEPAAYSILEAMARGVPAITTPDNGTSCYVEHGRNGWIVPSAEDGALEQLLFHLARHKDVVEAVGREAWKTVHTQHDPTKIASRLVECLGERL